MAFPIGVGAMAGVQENPDLYALPFLITPTPIRYFLRTARPGAILRGTNIEALFVFRIPTQGAFGHQLNTIVDLAWGLLPQRWKQASSLHMAYAFHPDNPKLQADGNRVTITYS